MIGDIGIISPPMNLDWATTINTQLELRSTRTSRREERKAKMSWLGSLSGSLPSDNGCNELPCDAWVGEDESIDRGSPRRRAKEDLSELTKTLTGKFWGAASFLAPPPSFQTPSSSSSPRIYSSGDSSPSSCNRRLESTIPGESESQKNAGIRSNFADIGGTIKSGIARLSSNVAFNGISMITSSFLPVREEENEEESEECEKEDESVCDVIGVTNEVLAFAKNIACHPETWLDFPLLSDDEEFDDFDLSAAQHDHALVIESLAPRLAALRIELCPTHMSIGCFWKIYFALVHPRLKKHDANLLSTPQIERARAMLHQKGSQEQSKDLACHHHHLLNPSNFPEQPSSALRMPAPDDEFVDKFVVNEEPCLRRGAEEMSFGDDVDDEWPEDEAQDFAPLLDGEDISFSDLEDEKPFKIGSKAGAH